MKKNALLLTYHLLEYTRVAGFHKISDLLIKHDFNVDFVTIPFSIYWLFKNNDRENFTNFRKLMRKIPESVEKNVSNFSVPSFVPFRIQEKLSIRNSKWIQLIYWNRLKRRLKSHYDLIIIESTTAVLLFDFLRNTYPDSKIVYRPSDPLIAYSKSESLLCAESNILKNADDIWFVNKSSKDFCESKYGCRLSKYRIIHNALISEKELKKKKQDKPIKRQKKTILYLGVFPIDYELIRRVAKKFPEVDIVIIGPYKDILKMNNIVFTGPLPLKEAKRLLSEAHLGIVPYIKKGRINELFEITGKIAIYMASGLPIVAINVSRKLNEYHCHVVSSIKEFIGAVEKYLRKSDAVSIDYSEYLLEYTIESFENEVSNAIEYLLQK